MFDQVPDARNHTHPLGDSRDETVTVEETMALTRLLLEKSRQTLQLVSATSAREREERLRRLRQRRPPETD